MHLAPGAKQCSSSVSTRLNVCTMGVAYIGRVLIACTLTHAYIGWCYDTNLSYTYISNEMPVSYAHRQAGSLLQWQHPPSPGSPTAMGKTRLQRTHARNCRLTHGPCLPACACRYLVPVDVHRKTGRGAATNPQTQRKSAQTDALVPMVAKPQQPAVRSKAQSLRAHSPSYYCAEQQALLHCVCTHINIQVYMYFHQVQLVRCSSWQAARSSPLPHSLTPGAQAGS